LTIPHHAWRGEQGASEYTDVPGFCASATVAEIVEHRYVLTPGRYVGAEEAEEDDEPVSDRIARLTEELFGAFEESDRLRLRVRAALEQLHV
jgi:type I restriction enzyme M protein